MARSKSSKRWLNEHFEDHWVKQARQAGYRSRAAFKLLEIDERDRLLPSARVVVDLGCAPGGWCQVASAGIPAGGTVIGLDILEMEEIPGVHFIRGDFTAAETLRELEALLAERGLSAEGRPGVDLVLSDMAPNISGMDAIDQPRAMHLAELAADFARQHLRSGGNFLVKVFQGEGFDDFLRVLRSGYRGVASRKPKASRPRSREIYLLGKGYRPAGLET